MLMGLALSIAGIAVVVTFKLSETLSTVVVIFVAATWFAGACAMVGYVRWFFASELLISKQNKEIAEAKERKNGLQ